MRITGLACAAGGLVLIAGSSLADSESRESCAELRVRAQTAIQLIDAGGESELRGRGDLLRLAKDLLDCSGDGEESERGGGTRQVESALLYLRAAVPGKATAYDSSLRREPGQGWNEFLELVRDMADAPSSSAGQGLLYSLLLLDVSDVLVDAGPLYGQEYYAPALAEWQEHGSVEVRMRAAAFIVKHSIWCDWTLACETALGAAELERVAKPQSVSEAGEIRRCIDAVFEAIREGLDRRRHAVRFALEQYDAEHRDPLEDEVLCNPARLWDALAPWLRKGVVRGNVWPRLNAEWIDLDSNPFETTPGLRVAVEPSGGAVIQLVYWESIEEYGQRPWTERYNMRVEALRRTRGVTRDRRAR